MGVATQQRKATTVTTERQFQTAPQRITLDDDVLLRDDVFLAEVLAGANRRTGKRYERDGLPYVLVRGLKYRPLREGREWLANRIQRPNQKPARGGRP
jgi:hypothetical protein